MKAINSVSATRMEIRQKLIADGLRSVQQLSLLRIWIRACGDASIPDIASLQPEDLQRARDSIALFDVHDGPRFHIRYMGVQLQKAYGGEPIGKYLDQIIPASSQKLKLHGYYKVISTREPTFAGLRLEKDDGTHILYERLLLPFLVQSPDVKIVLAAINIFSEMTHFVFDNALREYRPRA